MLLLASVLMPIAVLAGDYGPPPVLILGAVECEATPSPLASTYVIDGPNDSPTEAGAYVINVSGGSITSIAGVSVGAIPSVKIAFPLRGSLSVAEICRSGVPPGLGPCIPGIEPLWDSFILGVTWSNCSTIRAINVVQETLSTQSNGNGTVTITGGIAGTANVVIRNLRSVNDVTFTSPLCGEDTRVTASLGTGCDTPLPTSYIWTIGGQVIGTSTDPTTSLPINRNRENELTVTAVYTMECSIQTRPFTITLPISRAFARVQGPSLVCDGEWGDYYVHSNPNVDYIQWRFSRSGIRITQGDQYTSFIRIESPGGWPESFEISAEVRQCGETFWIRKTVRRSTSPGCSGIDIPIVSGGDRDDLLQNRDGQISGAELINLRLAPNVVGRNQIVRIMLAGEPSDAAVVDDLISVFDAQGRLVERLPTGSQVIQIDKRYAPGHYYVRANSSGTSAKMLVQ